MTDAPRVALVTGGTRGIGRAVTERLISDGVTVVAAYATDHDSANELRDRLANDTTQVSVRQADVGNEGQCRDLVASVLEVHGRLDYVVNNAGTVIEQRLAEITEADWHTQLGVNLSASFFLAQAAIPAMVDQGFGRVVNVGSVTALMGSPVQIAYGAAKAGLSGLTRSLARSVARKGITVNCVIPGSIETDMSASLRYTDASLVTPLIPMGRWGTPEEVAHAVAFLLDERSSYITGSVLTVDGGMSMGG
ncbi:MAG TPA: SDR family NAD(P)-dependent oxidoreductase [Mycobacteriales bacterium]|jgi:acetoacetyl-CoA reductase/3-oxoacyl-[acyl-carrier protein] reductase|nr:SDR family NAD(P)-dependent oxidoreductase [Mycobacteriales bacterium]